MKSVYAAAIGLISLSGVSLSSAAMAGPAEGVWLSEDGDTKVQIFNCGGKLCGTVIWLEEPIDPDTGKPKTDFNNPDPAKRGRPLIGLQVVNGLSPDGPGRWSGAIYNADDGRTYEASMQVRGTRVVRVQGCVLKLLCKAHTWTRAD
jgi:uncharacterized protein (DUF2147 family)